MDVTPTSKDTSRQLFPALRRASTRSVGGLGRRGRPRAPPPPRACHARPRAFPDEVALELRDAREDAEDEATRRIALGTDVEALRHRHEAHAEALEFPDVREDVQGG